MLFLTGSYPGSDEGKLLTLAISDVGCVLSVLLLNQLLIVPVKGTFLLTSIFSLASEAHSLR